VRSTARALSRDLGAGRVAIAAAGG